MPDVVATIVVAAAIIEVDGRFLMARRLAGTHLAGTWEFPGGKCDAGESREACLSRELREELDVEALVGEEVLSVEHRYPERHVRLHFHRCAIVGTPRPVLGQELRWVTREELGAIDVPPADRELVELLAHGARPNGSPQ